MLFVCALPCARPPGRPLLPAGPQSMDLNPKKCLPLALALAALGALFAGAGCLMEGTYDAAVTTAEGDVVDVPMTPHPIHTSDGVVTVDLFQYAPVTLPDGTNRLDIKCQAEFSGGARPVSALVRDVTEDPIITVIDDRSPALAAGGRWTATTRPLGPTDDDIRWVANIDNSIRIYRFTFTLADRSVHVLTVPVIVPAMLKDIFRARFAAGVHPAGVNP
jgi:hypothetical protein